MAQAKQFHMPTLRNICRVQSPVQALPILLNLLFDFSKFISDCFSNSRYGKQVEYLPNYLFRKYKSK